MEDLVVHPNAQRTGVGRALFEETHRLAAARGAVSLELKVWTFNRNAQEFYGRNGDASAQRDHGDAACGDWEFSTEL